MRTFLAAVVLAAGMVPVAGLAQSDSASKNQPATAVGSGTSKALETPATTQPHTKRPHHRTMVAGNRHKAAKPAPASPDSSTNAGG